MLETPNSTKGQNSQQVPKYSDHSFSRVITNTKLQMSFKTLLYVPYYHHSSVLQLYYILIVH